MNQSKIKYGQHIHETRLQGQTYFEAYGEKLSDSFLYPETLAQVNFARGGKQAKGFDTRGQSSDGATLGQRAHYPDKETLLIGHAGYDRRVAKQTPGNVSHVAFGPNETADETPLR